MNTKQLHPVQKTRGSADVSYLGRSVDEMIWGFMEKEQIPGLTLAIVQAPYIPRVAGYGMSDGQKRLLASASTMWPAGPISQAFAAVAVMQLHESGKLSVHDACGRYLTELPDFWKEIPILTLLRHASGLPDYREAGGWRYDLSYGFSDLLAMVASLPLAFEPGTAVRQSATNFLLLTEIVERVCGKSYHDFVKENQIEYLNLRHTAFAGDLGQFSTEDVQKTGNVHQAFKSDFHFIDPTEPAVSYGPDGSPVSRGNDSALRGFSDIWASAGDISFWDIALAGSVLIHEPENRALVYSPWTAPGGAKVPAVAGWQFYHHRGLMDIKGSVPGYTSFLSRFTHAEELVCVTLMANKEGVDFTNLARRIAGAFGDLLSTNYDDNRLYLYESQFSAEQTADLLEAELTRLEIPVFARFDHAENAKDAGLSLRPTKVLVFGSPKVGTGLMQLDQSISLELPLRISVWEDELGSVWLAFPRMDGIAKAYGMEDNPVIGNMEKLLENLVQKAGSIYSGTYLPE